MSRKYVICHILWKTLLLPFVIWNYSHVWRSIPSACLGRYALPQWCMRTFCLTGPKWFSIRLSCFSLWPAVLLSQYYRAHNTPLGIVSTYPGQASRWANSLVCHQQRRFTPHLEIANACEALGSSKHGVRCIFPSIFLTLISNSSFLQWVPFWCHLYPLT